MNKKKYFYELHMHTAEVSACASTPAADMARMFASKGYSGMVLTDHFFNGNSTIGEHLSWKQKVSAFMQSFYEAQAATKDLDFDVFFGFEYNDNGTEFLIYGLGEEFLYTNPDLLSWDLKSFLKKVKEAGGLVSHAHPFRMASYIPETRLFPDLIDAVEVLNMRNSSNENWEALQYAEKLKLPKLAGSDIHNLSGKRIKVFSDHRIRDNKDLVNSIINGTLTYDPREEEKLNKPQTLF